MVGVRCCGDEGPRKVGDRAHQRIDFLRQVDRTERRRVMRDEDDRPLHRDAQRGRHCGAIETRERLDKVEGGIARNGHAPRLLAHLPQPR